MLHPIIKSIQTRGLWAGISLMLLLAKYRTKQWFGAHQRLTINSLMLGILAACSYTSYWLLHRHGQINSGMDVWSTTVLLSISLVGCIVTLSHFFVQPIYRRLILMKSIQFSFFAILVGGLGYIGYDAWTSLYSQQPAEATLLAVVFAIVLYGLCDIAFLFARSALVKNMAVADLKELPSLSREGKYRAAIHEAGHALCYGLCDGVPEDAYVAIDEDMNELIGGRVNLPVPREPTDFTKPHIEWELLLLMAGVAAEEVVFGDGSMLGGGDLESFNLNGGIYLMSGHGEVYAMKPETELDVAVNRAAIGRLRDDFKMRAKSLISANRALVERMARDLSETDFMDCEEISERVRGINKPEGFIPVKWPESLAVLRN